MSQVRHNGWNGSPPPDIADLQRGSEAAWTQVVRTLGPHLRSYISMCGADDPDGTLGDVFLELSKAVARYDGDWEGFRTLAFVVARRRTIDGMRYRSRRPTVALDKSALDGSPGGDVEQEALRQLDRDWALALLDTLTPTQRDVLTMRVVVGLSIREVAQIMETTETAVKANQRRAIDALRRHLTAEGSTLEEVFETATASGDQL